MKQDDLDPFNQQSPFEGLERARRKRLLLAITDGAVPALIPMVLFFGFMWYNNPSWQIGVVFFMTMSMIPMSLLSHRLAQKDKIDLGGYLLLFYFLLAIGINGLLIESLFIAIAPAYAVVLVMAGMLLGTRASYIIAVLASGLWLVIRRFAEIDWIVSVPVPPILINIAIGIIIVFAFLFTAFMSQLATRDLRRALQDATYELVQANRQLKRASRLKSQFTARTSHELRTPLSAIMVFTDLTLREAYGPLTTRQQEGMTRVLRNAERLHVLIEDILDLSKIEAGELEIVAEPFAVEGLVETARAALETAAREKDLVLQINVAPEMPAYVVGDERRLGQILLNLTDNAIKFADEGTVSVTIEPNNDGQWQISVTDTGRGLREKDRQRIFEEFRRLDTDHTRPPGAGLGLAITQQLVERMGGEIRVESELGKGSTFQVILPLEVSHTL